MGPTATPAQVAAEWPRWYAANRDAVGPDPDLLRVGVVLEAPAAGGTP
jgi:nucleoid-associated protein YgaU